MSDITRREFLGNAALAPALLRGAARLQPRRPNILFLFPDQWRFDWMSGFDGIPIRTPHLDRLAGLGVRFRRATVAAPLCGPSRACLATGCEYDQCSVPNHTFNFPLDADNYYKRLRDVGYHVAACGKLDLSKAANDQGLDGRRDMEAWGFSDMVNNAGKMDAVRGATHDPYMVYLDGRNLSAVHREDFSRRPNYSATFPTPLPDDAYCDNWVGEQGLALMRRVPAGQPWHLVVNFVGPHDPEDITTGMEKTVRDRMFRQPNAPAQFTPEIHNVIRQNYTAMCENLDRWVGIYLDEVARRGELDNTVIVFSSDHGEMLGDHGRWAKSIPYEASIGVPLIVAAPGVRGGQLSTALVSHTDISATFLDYADAGSIAGQTSRSLRPLLEERTSVHREFVHSGLAAWRLVQDDRYKLVRGFSGPGELQLFDLVNDPFENDDIAASTPDVVARLSRLLPPPNPDPAYNGRGGGRGGARGRGEGAAPPVVP